MWDDFENEFGQSDLDYHISRFESFVKNNEVAFFDVDVFEEIIDHYIMTNQLKKAQQGVEMALTHYPQNSMFKLRQAQILLNHGKLNTAIRILDDIELLEPDNEEVFITKASAYSQQKKVNEAIAYYEKALAVMDKFEADEVFLDLAIEYENNKDFSRAVIVLHEALKYNPENESALYELAFCYESMNDYEQAIKQYSLFIDENPYSYIAWYNLGNAYVKVLDYEKAVWAFDYCNIICEDFYSAYYNKANAYFQLEKYEDAIEAYQSSLIDTPEDGFTFCYIGECYEKMEQYQDAIHYYKKAIAVNADVADAWLGIGIAYDNMGKLKEAVSYFRKAIDIEPDNPIFYTFLADVYEDLGDFEAQERLLIEGIKLSNQAPDLVKAYAVFLEKRERLNEAINLVEQFLLQTQNGEMSMLLVKFFWQNMRFTDALLLCDQTLEKDFNAYNSLIQHFPEAESIKEFSNIIELNRNK